MSASILERCRVAPPAEGKAASKQTLPLTFMDLPWLHFHPIQRLLFYEFPCSKIHFIQTIVPNLKISLPNSQTLFPTSWLRNHPRVADEFHDFYLDLPPPETEPESEFQKIALFTVQITLFPETGVCVGFNNHHIVGDASSIVRFVKAWSSVSKLGGDHDFLTSSDSLPLYDRSVVKDPSGLLNHYWNQMKDVRIQSSPLNFPINKVRSTYILQKHDIQKLRDFVQSKKPHLTHLSSFTITSAYVWTCLVKSAEESGEEVDGGEPEYFAFAVDTRLRMAPPVPAAYFGNCVGMAAAESTHAELKGDDGFLIAVELIGDVISNKVNKEGELMRDADEWLAKFGALIGKRLFGVAGSPKFDLYDADFGWGKAEKCESVSIDGDGSMSLGKSREFEGGLEIGVSLSKKKMDAFANIFASGFQI
ncbi:hypothetical protein C2S51_001432 [Perilla frutescens var. frutescens]|nr:hypothetical protein C2S51_001432 [Perilla frutescens var. frutescens]